MSDKNLTCPTCQSPLSKWVCDECGRDIRDLFAGQRQSVEQVCETLAQAGAFVDRSTKNLVIPGSDVWAYSSFSTSHYTTRERDLLAEHVRNLCALPVKRFAKPEVQRFLYDLYNKCPAVLPQVTHVGDKPQLFLHENGELVWPFTHESKRCRIYEYGNEGLLYTGPILKPRPTGAFEEFLQDTRCADEDNRTVLRQWLRTAVCPSLFTPGQFPLLLLCAKQNSSVGKSCTAYALGDLLGGSLDIYWEDHYSIDDLNRMLMDPCNRVLILDNIRPGPGQLVFDSSRLANFITQKELAVKVLYRTSGVCKVPARYQFIATANYPRFSGELLNRFSVCTLAAPPPDPEADKKPDWNAKWLSRRVEVLEDLLYTTMENWKKGELGPIQRRFRFLPWQKIAQRLDQNEPIVIPRTSMVRSPLELLLKELWEQYKYIERVEWGKIESFLKNANTGTAAVVKNQIEISWEAFKSDLEAYHGLFYGEQDEDGSLWICRR